MTNIKRLLRYAIERQQPDSLILAAIGRTALEEIERLEAELGEISQERYADEECDGCCSAPTDGAPTYAEECMSCRRYYGDLYEKVETTK